MVGLLDRRRSKTTADVEYKWKQPDPVQFAKNILLPGGFELTSYLNRSYLNGSRQGQRS